MSSLPKKPRCYLNCIIYKVSSLSRPDLVYYGHTTENLKKRFTIHKARTNRTTSKQIVDIGDPYIEIVEAYPCSNKEQAETRERFYIENFKCVNKICPRQTPKEHYQKTKHKKREYYLQNKTHISQYLHRRYYRKQSELLHKNIKTFVSSTNSHHILNDISKLYKTYDKNHHAENIKILSQSL